MELAKNGRADEEAMINVCLYLHEVEFAKNSQAHGLYANTPTSIKIYISLEL